VLTIIEKDSMTISEAVHRCLGVLPTLVESLKVFGPGDVRYGVLSPKKHMLSFPRKRTAFHPIYVRHCLLFPSRAAKTAIDHRRLMMMTPTALVENLLDPRHRGRQLTTEDRANALRSITGLVSQCDGMVVDPPHRMIPMVFRDISVPENRRHSGVHW
jgi:hypothetical protein